MVKMTMAGIGLLKEMEAPDPAYAGKKGCARMGRVRLRWGRMRAAGSHMDAHDRK